MKDFGKLNFSVAFQPTSAFPLDGRTVFSSYASALTAAKTAEEVGSTNTKYHIGMKLLVVENDVPTWYTITKDKTLAAESADAESAITEHNASSEAHADIRTLLSELTKRLNALADSDDTTLDQLSELVAYIKNNRSLIEQVTTGKVSVDAIVNDLTTNNSKKVLSAAQGVAIKALIDALDKKITDSGVEIPEKLPNPYALTFTGAATGTYDGSSPLTVNIPEGGSSITVDDAFNPESTNPVQNKVICAFVLEANKTVLQIQNSIPTDEHINGLINTALGIIESDIDEINGEDV